MAREYTGRNVLDAALSRITSVYREGHRVIVAFSAGKDSGIVLELCIMAARETGNLPVEVMFRDDEILYPGTHEYAARIYARPEIKMHWISCRQAEVNIYNRESPYFWVYDERLHPEQWVNQPPPYIEWMLDNINLYSIINSYAFPPPPGKMTCAIVGIRTEESKQRLFTVHSIHGARSYAANDPKIFNLYPVYDWKLGDVWKATRDNKWDYNEAYDVMNKMGVPPMKQRIAAAAMTDLGTDVLQIAARAWPRWWDRVCDRLPGIRAVAYYGARVLQPQHKIGEAWSATYQRECIDHAPEWVRRRSIYASDKLLQSHSTHSSTTFPEVEPCKACGKSGSWKALAMAIYSGDPFHIRVSFLPDLQPQEFRPEETRYFARDHKEAIKQMKTMRGEK